MYGAFPIATTAYATPLVFQVGQDAQATASVLSLSANLGNSTAKGGATGQVTALTLSASLPSVSVIGQALVSVQPLSLIASLSTVAYAGPTGKNPYRPMASPYSKLQSPYKSFT